MLVELLIRFQEWVSPHDWKHIEVPYHQRCENCGEERYVGP